MPKSKSLTQAEQTAIDRIKSRLKTSVAANAITINSAVQIFKRALDGSIRAAGEKGKESLIRSSAPIKIFHEVIKHELIRNGIRQNLVFPNLGNNQGELSLHGYFKDKSQDICVKPNNVAPRAQILTTGLLNGKSDPFGDVYTERVLTINVRSQMSSIEKNLDTMFERIFAEPLNLHMRCREIVMGEFYIIPVTGYDSDQLKLKKPIFSPKIINRRYQGTKTTAEVLEEYILAFQSVNNRNIANGEEYKYERVCLLIIDFTVNPIRIYQTTQDLQRDHLLPLNTTADLNVLSFNTFIPDLLRIYATRFGAGKLS